MQLLLSFQSSRVEIHVSWQRIACGAVSRPFTIAPMCLPRALCCQAMLSVWQTAAYDGESGRRLVGTTSCCPLPHGLLLLARSSSSQICPSGVTLPHLARMRRSPSGPCASVSGFKARLVRLFLPHICCGRAPARIAARTRSRSHSMVQQLPLPLAQQAFSPPPAALTGSRVVHPPQRSQPRPLLLSPGCLRALFSLPASSQQRI